MSRRPTVLKVGGSVITQKKKPFTANLSTIKRIAAEISEARVEKLVIVHGGGSFGHPLAKQYSIMQGYTGKKSQLLGFSKTHEAMITLNKLVLDALIQNNIPAVTISPSSCVVTKSGRILMPIKAPLRELVDKDFVPLLFGDAVVDADLGFTILSGDQLAACLAEQLGAERIVMGIDEDGLFDDDPKLSKSARLLTECTLHELKEMRQRMKSDNSTDVTGAMLGKIIELIPAIERGIQALIVNAAKPRNVYKALKGEGVTGTIIKE